MLQSETPRLVLASASTARRAVLAGAGLRFVIQPAVVDETAIRQVARQAGLDASGAALQLANAKAADVARQQPQALVIGADQILDCGGTWFDKPPDRAAARLQLLALRRREHALATAVVCRIGDRMVWQHVALPRLIMRAFSETFLDAYLAAEGDAVLSSVGAYRLEGPGVQLFEQVDGDHSAILGLPLLPLLAFLRSTGVVAT